ncbi:unnamed protein product [Urochloa humidicola]
MDTEFPGIVCRPICAFRSLAEYNYATLKANVDVLHLIQLGLTFSGPRGELPALGAGRRRYVLQFNFREFDDACDIFASDSIHLLRRGSIDIRRNAERGWGGQRGSWFAGTPTPSNPLPLRFSCADGSATNCDCSMASDGLMTK